MYLQQAPELIKKKLKKKPLYAYQQNHGLQVLEWQNEPHSTLKFLNKKKIMVNNKCNALSTANWHIASIDKLRASNGLKYVVPYYAMVL